MEKKLIHICEVCGKTEIMTPEETFNDGWTIRREWEVLVLWDREHAGIVQ